MALPKNSLRKEPQILDLSTKQIILGIILGLSFAISFYSFIYVFREFFRLLTTSEFHDLLILSAKEMWFYNLFYASIATIFGHSVCFTFWLDRPKKLFGLNNHRKIAIIHEQRFLNAYFLHWFSKVATLIALAFYVSFKVHYVFDFYEDYKFVFILIPIVLYLQLWNSIRLTFKSHSIKWQLYSLATIWIITFCLSHFNLIDTNKINQSILSKNVFHTHNLKLPSLNYDSHNNYYPYVIIYVVKDSTPPNNQGIKIIFDNETIELEDLSEKLEKKIMDRFWSSSYRVRLKLYIDKSIKMYWVNKLKILLKANDLNNVSFAFLPEKRTLDERLYWHNTFPYRLPYLSTANNPLPLPPNYLKTIANIITLKHSHNNGYKINNRIVNKDKIETSLYPLIKQQPDCIIKYYMSEEIEFKDYLSALTATKKVIDKLRDEYSKSKYGKNYYDLEYYYQKEVRIKYPYRIQEVFMVNKTCI